MATTKMCIHVCTVYVHVHIYMYTGLHAEDGARVDKMTLLWFNCMNGTRYKLEKAKSPPPSVHCMYMCTYRRVILFQPPTFSVAV